MTTIMALFMYNTRVAQRKPLEATTPTLILVFFTSLENINGAIQFAL